MDRLVLFKESNLKSLLNKRPGESKFGEHISVLTETSHIYEQLNTLDVQYVIFGIPEDVGVFANLGKTGTSGAWHACLKVLLNIQSNAFTHASRVLILGHLDFSKEMEKMKDLNQTTLDDLQIARKMVSKIDKHVTDLMTHIIKAGKTPIVIGGGHNNAYGNIKGTSLALKKPINVINFDAHSDFRNEEGRHSGNGFSYAYSEGFLKNYFIFGLHENYTSDVIFKQLQVNPHLDFNTFESMEIRKELAFKSEVNRALEFVQSKPYGIELDCDAIENVPSSAMTPSGFSVTKTRYLLSSAAASKQVKYLHLCEAAPTPETETQVGKLLTYLLTDFIRAHANA
ncbi:formimidoylglutamase [Bizionia myxarmorum]|uniref:Formimidoylglutamase n=1 Tax=Bizionia myxarmorum TaxID=291186 RepID=A0A5D0R4N0_9FLAO|nr:formimidoylglutamase [Bizionia myxarmorum]TYB76383.1 formimidoylglutamase [Bizionia myxarmorum]